MVPEKGAKSPGRGCSHVCHRTRHREPGGHRWEGEDSGVALNTLSAFIHVALIWIVKERPGAADVHSK